MPRISNLPALTTADNTDEIAIVDTSASVTKKITRGDLLKSPLPANAINTQAIADGSVTPAKISGMWWEEIGRTTLGANGASISVASLPARKYIQIIVNVIYTGGALNPILTFNGDTGSNYAIRASENGGADATATSTGITVGMNAAAGATSSITIEVTNIAAREKHVKSEALMTTATGVANPPGRRLVYGKWTNTSASINTITIAASANSFLAGSEVVVLAHD